MLLTQKKEKRLHEFFLCFDQKPLLLYNYVFTEVVPFRKYCHIFSNEYNRMFLLNTHHQGGLDMVDFAANFTIHAIKIGFQK